MTRFNAAVIVVKKSDEKLLHMEIVAEVNKRSELSRVFTNKKTRNLDDFFYGADQYLRLETVDVELAMVLQPDVGQLS